MINMVMVVTDCHCAVTAALVIMAVGFLACVVMIVVMVVIIVAVPRTGRCSQWEWGSWPVLRRWLQSWCSFSPRRAATSASGVAYKVSLHQTLICVLQATNITFEIFSLDLFLLFYLVHIPSFALKIKGNVWISVSARYPISVEENFRVNPKRLNSTSKAKLSKRRNVKAVSGHKTKWDILDKQQMPIIFALVCSNVCT